MKISVNVKLYAFKDFVNGDVNNSVFRSLVADVTKFEDVPSVSDCGYAMCVYTVVSPISKMLRTMCSSSQFLAVLETISYTVRESLERSADWFHATDYEEFQVSVETKII